MMKQSLGEKFFVVTIFGAHTKRRKTKRRKTKRRISKRRKLQNVDTTKRRIANRRLTISHDSILFHCVK
jgi:hypothetical protein